MSLGVLQPRQAEEAGDGEDPGGEVRAGLEAADLRPGAEKGLLDDLVAVFARTEVAGDEARDSRLMAAHQLPEGLPVHAG